MMRARMVSSLTLSRLSAFARGKRGIFHVVSVGDQSAGRETEGKSCSHYKTEYFICRYPHNASFFLATVRHYVMLEVDKTRAITPPPEKTKQYIVLLACNHTKNLRYKNAKGSTRSISPDAKRSTGVIVPPPMQQERHAGRDPSHAAGGKHSGSSAAPYSKRAALGRLSFDFFGCFGANPRSRETL